MLARNPVFPPVGNSGWEGSEKFRHWAGSAKGVNQLAIRITDGLSHTQEFFIKYETSQLIFNGVNLGRGSWKMNYG